MSILIILERPKPRKARCGVRLSGKRGCSIDSTKKSSDLLDLVDDYRRLHASGANDEARLFRSAPSIEVAIHHASLAIDEDGKCFGHQFRIKQSARKEAKRRLLMHVPRIQGCRSFDALYQLLNELLADVYGIGELYIYDAAYRMGQYLSLSPDHVYLHAGTREGARSLGLDASRNRLTISDFPKPLRKLSAADLENFLCIYRRFFVRYA